MRLKGRKYARITCHVISESMTHSEDEEEIRHLFGLPDSTIAIIGVDGDFNDS